MFELLVTARSFGFAGARGIEALQGLPGVSLTRPEHEQAFTEAEMCALVPGKDALIVGTDQVTRQVIECADRLKVISKHGVGVDNIDLAAASAAGILVTNLPNMNDKAVADMTFGLILSLVRGICRAGERSHQGRGDKFLAHDVWGRTLGVIGTGRIGREVVRRAQAFDMRVIAYDLYPNPDAAGRFGFRYVSLEELLQAADIVTIHVPLTAHTRGLVGAAEIAQMKSSAYLINTARGGIVDELALVQALSAGRLAGAALDVYDKSLLAEPGAYGLDNLLLTPHVAAYTVETLEAMDLALVGEYERVLGGELPMNLLNRDILPHARFVSA
ncbi:MAG: phosphoglycerate dehydrogenase [Chloroflexi bacterium]|nr:phosphoglycerate dehydrogenase [Chloroflexota bacterium]